ncbi:MAG: zinc ribbon domain-containing protein [Nanoarchaeota archaeon]
MAEQPSIPPAVHIIIGGVVLTASIILNGQSSGNFILFIIIGAVMIAFGAGKLIIGRRDHAPKETHHHAPRQHNHADHANQQHHHTHQHQRQNPVRPSQYKNPGQDYNSSQHPLHFCPNCGARLPQGVNFCPNCGARLR